MGIADHLKKRVGDVKADAPSQSTERALAQPKAKTAVGENMIYGAQLQTALARQRELEALLEEARKGGSAIDIPLENLHEVPGRRRYMAPEKYAELRENLRHNKLIHPVVVLPRLEGGFDIQSGHHRTDAYRELGRATIRCVLGDATGEEASVGAFYANLMQSDLTDYEKYLGFSEILERHPNTTQAQIADQAGIDRSAVSRLMAFEDLPPPVLSLLQNNPTLLGYNAVSVLSGLTKEGKADRVTDAVRQLATGAIDQAQAIKLATADPKTTKAAAPQRDVVKVRAGRSIFCEMSQGKNVVRLQFQSEEQARSVRAAIQKVLEDHAKGLQRDE